MIWVPHTFSSSQMHRSSFLQSDPEGPSRNWWRKWFSPKRDDFRSFGIFLVRKGLASVESFRVGIDPENGSSILAQELSEGSKFALGRWRDGAVVIALDEHGIPLDLVFMGTQGREYLLQSEEYKLHPFPILF